MRSEIYINDINKNEFDRKIVSHCDYKDTVYTDNSKNIVCVIISGLDAGLNGRSSDFQLNEYVWDV